MYAMKSGRGNTSTFRRIENGSPKDAVSATTDAEQNGRSESSPMFETVR